MRVWRGRGGGGRKGNSVGVKKETGGKATDMVGCVGRGEVELSGGEGGKGRSADAKEHASRALNAVPCSLTSALSMYHLNSAPCTPPPAPQRLNRRKASTRRAWLPVRAGFGAGAAVRWSCCAETPKTPQQHDEQAIMKVVLPK
eukprot:349597-Chlamydomonas_euryale.AAC.2